MPEPAIGTSSPAEWRDFTDERTGRRIRQLTSAAASSYPLYYFIPTITDDGRYLVFHSERTGWVQLHRMDLQTGEIVQMTDGRTRDSGWAIWCEHHLRGIYNHLSALNTAKREVYHFEDDRIVCTNVDSLAARTVHEMPGRISIGQSAFSPDGRHFAFIHADHDLFKRAIADREALANMGQDGWRNHEQWRRQVPVTIGLIDTHSGEYRDVIALDFHVHHVLFLDNDRLLINHLQSGNGMWTINIDGTGRRDLRPPDEHGTICHQIITQRGVLYEANQYTPTGTQVWFGWYDPASDTHEEVQLPGVNYVHTGNDPAGRFLFLENQDGQRGHELLTVHHPRDTQRYRLNLLRELPPIERGQRYHAHPFLSPDRRRMFYTEVVDGFSQICAMDVEDLVDLDEYW